MRCGFQANVGHFLKLKIGKNSIELSFFNNIFRIANMWLAVMSKNIYGYKELVWMEFWKKLMVISCASNKRTQCGLFFENFKNSPTLYHIQNWSMSHIFRSSKVQLNIATQNLQCRRHVKKITSNSYILIFWI